MNRTKKFPVEFELERIYCSDCSGEMINPFSSSKLLNELNNLPHHMTALTKWNFINPKEPYVLRCTKCDKEQKSIYSYPRLIVINYKKFGEDVSEFNKTLPCSKKSKF